MKTKHITQILLLAFVVSLGVESVYSQTEELKLKNSLQDGMWALQFQISNNFTLSSFQGTVISIKRNYTPHHAIRVGVSLNSDFGNVDRSSTSFTPDTIGNSNTSTLSSNNQNISLTGQYLFYSNPQAEVNFFFGGGPTIGYSRGSSESESILRVPGLIVGKSANDGNNSSWLIGLSGAAGIEWFVTSEFSLHAEYDASFSYIWQKDESNDKTYSTSGVLLNRDTRENSRKNFLFSGNSVRFGLSVYF